MPSFHSSNGRFTHALVLSCLLFAFLASSQAQAQVVCQKTAASGKVKLKLRDVCKIEKGEETVADLSQLAQIAQLGDLNDAVSQLRADIDAVPRTRVLGTAGGATTVGTALELLNLGGGDTFEFETFAESSNAHVTFDSDCGLNADLGEFIQINIVVDGTPVIPTAVANDVFCSAMATPNLLAPNPGSRTVVVEDLPAGAHSIQVFAQATSGAALMTDGSLSVIVSENEVAEDD